MRLSYSASVDDIEIMSGALNTKGNTSYDEGEMLRAAFYYGASAGVDQLLRLGRPEDAAFRVASAWTDIKGRLFCGNDEQDD